MARYQILMEQLSVTMEEGTIIDWHKNIGDRVDPGDVLAEVTTDKVNMEITSPYEGVLQEILVQAGDTTPVMAPIAIIDGRENQTVFHMGSSQDAGASAAPAQVDQNKIETTRSETPSTEQPVLASPIARKSAASLGINLASVQGTGPHGRITLDDVEQYLEKVNLPPSGSQVVAATAEARPETHPRESMPIENGAQGATLPMHQGGEKRPLSNSQAVMAKRMVESWSHVPHVTYCMAADVAAASSLRSYLAGRDIQISYVDLLIKSAANALAENPIINSSFLGNSIVYNAQINIGVATDTEYGLIVPVVKDCRARSLVEISECSRDLIHKAREGKLSLDEISGGTFTISNMGMMGMEYFTPIINPPESAILGVCAIAEKQVVADGKAMVRPMMNLCLSCDHRHIDGATAAKFLKSLISSFEHPFFDFGHSRG